MVLITKTKNETKKKNKKPFFSSISRNESEIKPFRKIKKKHTNLIFFSYLNPIRQELSTKKKSHSFSQLNRMEIWKKKR